MISEAFAASGSAGGGGGLIAWLPMWIAIIAIMYFLIIRPQKKKQQDQDNMLRSLKKGDHVLTVSGIYGTISNIKENNSIIVLKIADNVRIEITLSSVAQKVDRKK